MRSKIILFNRNFIKPTVTFKLPTATVASMSVVLNYDLINLIILFLGYIEESFCLPYSAVDTTACENNPFVTALGDVSKCFADFCAADLCLQLTPDICKAVPSNGGFCIYLRIC